MKIQGIGNYEHNTNQSKQNKTTAAVVISWWILNKSRSSMTLKQGRKLEDK